MRKRFYPAQLRTPGRLFRAGRRQAARTGGPLPETFTVGSCRNGLYHLRTWYVEKNFGMDVRKRGSQRI